MNVDFKVIGLTRLEIKPESIALEADAAVKVEHFFLPVLRQKSRTRVKAKKFFVVAHKKRQMSLRYHPLIQSPNPKSLNYTQNFES